MKRFDGNALSWALADGVVELALHRPPANELSMAGWAELEQFRRLGVACRPAADCDRAVI